MQHFNTDANQPACDQARILCLARKPNKKNKYYLLLGCIGREVAFYSKGISWEDGIEVRVARAVNASETAELYLKKNKDLLVLETMAEIELWLSHWRSAALVEISEWERYID